MVAHVVHSYSRTRCGLDVNAQLIIWTGRFDAGCDPVNSAL